jgi:hypothetical protein
MMSLEFRLNGSDQQIIPIINTKSHQQAKRLAAGLGAETANLKV